VPRGEPAGLKACATTASRQAWRPALRRRAGRPEGPALRRRAGRPEGLRYDGEPAGL